jgi:HTH-type transcriptional regulator, sugar sensing transcriptional regulator
MYTEVLEQLGLSPNEAKIYEALLELKEASAGAIAANAKIHRRNTYDAIHRLVEKGMIFSVLSKGDHVYSAVDPDKLMELIKEKETKLEKILPDLRKKHQTDRQPQEAYIYRGIEGFKNYMRDVLRQGENAYFIGAKLGWWDPRLKSFTEQFVKEAERKNIKFHHLFDSSVEKEGKEELKDMDKQNLEYRFLPEKYSTKSAIDFFGDQIVMWSGLSLRKLEDDVTLFVIRDKSLVDNYKMWWQFMWDHCENPAKQGNNRVNLA